MARIVPSEAAPAEAVHYSLAGHSFDLGGSKGKSYESNDTAVLAEAEVHPWLTVQRDAAEVVRGNYVDHLKPEDDVLSAINSVANDPKAAKDAQKATQDTVVPVAIDANEPQTQVVKTGTVAETLAADPTSKTSEKKDS